jgi:hypothetical protein
MNVSANPPQAGSDKPAESANQNNRSGDTESIDVPSQSGVVQSQTQFAALSAVTVTGRRDAGKAVESVAALGSKAARPTAGGRPAGESASSGRIKDKLGGDQQKGSQDLSETSAGSGQEPGRLTEKLNVENIDLVSDKNGTPKSESGNGASQTTSGQISALDTPQVAAGSRPVVADLPVRSGLYPAGQ